MLTLDHHEPTKALHPSGGRKAADSTASSDPIFAAIARDRRAGELELDDDGDAWRALADTRPTTAAGIAALAHHLRETLAGWGNDPDSFEMRCLLSIEEAALKL